LNFINIFWKIQLYNFVWYLIDSFFFATFYICLVLSFFLFCLWLVYSISVWSLLYFVQYYSLSIRLSLQYTRHTNQISAHIHLWTKVFPLFVFVLSYFASNLLPSRDMTWKFYFSMIHHTLHQIYYPVEIWHESFISVWSTILCIKFITE
jgi:hypothetical protein